MNSERKRRSVKGQTTRASVGDSELDESDEVEERLKKLLTNNKDQPRYQNIFNYTQEIPRLRRSVVARAIQNVICSTPMPTEKQRDFFYAENSLNLSPIEPISEEAKPIAEQNQEEIESCQDENKKLEKEFCNKEARVDLTRISDPIVISDSEDDLHEINENKEASHLSKNEKTIHNIRNKETKKSIENQIPECNEISQNFRCTDDTENKIDQDGVNIENVKKGKTLKDKSNSRSRNTSSTKKTKSLLQNKSKSQTNLKLSQLGILSESVNQIVADKPIKNLRIPLERFTLTGSNNAETPYKQKENIPLQTTNNTKFENNQSTSHYNLRLTNQILKEDQGKSELISAAPKENSGIEIAQEGKICRTRSQTRDKSKEKISCPQHGNESPIEQPRKDISKSKNFKDSQAHRKNISLRKLSVTSEDEDNNSNAEVSQLCRTPSKQKENIPLQTANHINFQKNRGTCKCNVKSTNQILNEDQHKSELICATPKGNSGIEIAQEGNIGRARSQARDKSKEKIRFPQHESRKDISRSKSLKDSQEHQNHISPRKLSFTSKDEDNNENTIATTQKEDKVNENKREQLSKIPVSRPRSKSREKSTMDLKNPVKNADDNVNSKGENLILPNKSPPKRPPRKKRQAKTKSRVISKGGATNNVQSHVEEEENSSVTAECVSTTPVADTLSNIISDKKQQGQKSIGREKHEPNETNQIVNENILISEKTLVDIGTSPFIASQHGIEGYAKNHSNEMIEAGTSTCNFSTGQDLDTTKASKFNRMIVKISQQLDISTNINKNLTCDVGLQKNLTDSELVNNNSNENLQVNKLQKAVQTCAEDENMEKSGSSSLHSEIIKDMDKNAYMLYEILQDNVPLNFSFSDDESYLESNENNQRDVPWRADTEQLFPRRNTSYKLNFLRSAHDIEMERKSWTHESRDYNSRISLYRNSANPEINTYDGTKRNNVRIYSRQTRFNNNSISQNIRQSRNIRRSSSSTSSMSDLVMPESDIDDCLLKNVKEKPITVTDSNRHSQKHNTPENSNKDINTRNFRNNIEENQFLMSLSAQKVNVYKKGKSDKETVDKVLPKNSTSNTEVLNLETGVHIEKGKTQENLKGNELFNQVSEIKKGMANVEITNKNKSQCTSLSIDKQKGKELEEDEGHGESAYEDIIEDATSPISHSRTVNKQKGNRPKRGEAHARTADREIENIEIVENTTSLSPSHKEPANSQSKEMNKTNPRTVNKQNGNKLKKGEAHATTADKEIVNVEIVENTTSPSPSHKEPPNSQSDEMNITNTRTVNKHNGNRPKRGKAHAITGDKEMGNVEIVENTTSPSPSHEGLPNSQSDEMNITNPRAVNKQNGNRLRRGEAHATTADKEIGNVENAALPSLSHKGPPISQSNEMNSLDHLSNNVAQDDDLLAVPLEDRVSQEFTMRRRSRVQSKPPHRIADTNVEQQSENETDNIIKSPPSNSTGKKQTSPVSLRKNTSSKKTAKTKATKTRSKKVIPENSDGVSSTTVDCESTGIRRSTRERKTIQRRYYGAIGTHSEKEVEYYKGLAMVEKTKIPAHPTKPKKTKKSMIVGDQSDEVDNTKIKKGGRGRKKKAGNTKKSKNEITEDITEPPANEPDSVQVAPSVSSTVNEVNCSPNLTGDELTSHSQKHSITTDFIEPSQDVVPIKRVRQDKNISETFQNENTASASKVNENNFNRSIREKSTDHAQFNIDICNNHNTNHTADNQFSPCSHGNLDSIEESTNIQKGLEKDSGRASMMRSAIFEESNLKIGKRLTGRISKNYKKKKNDVCSKISKVLSRSINISKEQEILSGKDKNTDCVNTSDDVRARRSSIIHMKPMDSEYINLLTNDTVVSMKYVEKVPKFKLVRDNLMVTDSLRNAKDGGVLGYLRLPPNCEKALHIARKFALFYFVIEGTGFIQVHNKTSTVGKLSSFIIPLGVEYSIRNTSREEVLTLGFIKMPPSD